MSIPAIDDLSLLHVALAGVGAVILVHLVPYILDLRGLRRFPGPFLAQFSDIWLVVVAKGGHRSETIHKLHQQYGEPNPIATPTLWYSSCVKVRWCVSHPTRFP